MGQKIRYIGASDEQVKWGGNDDPRGLLKAGWVYELYRSEVHSYHTKYYLAEFPGLKFNSVSFEHVEEK